MQRIAIILGLVSFVAAKGLAHHEDVRPNMPIYGSINVHGATDNRRVGAINLRQSGIGLEVFTVFGRFWGFPPGKYVGVVYQGGLRELNGTCVKAAPAVAIYHEKYDETQPMILFRVDIENGYEPVFVVSPDHVSLRPDAQYNITHHSVLIYRVESFQMVFLKRFLNPSKNQSAVACGVIVPGLIRPGNVGIPEDDQPQIDSSSAH